MWDIFISFVSGSAFLGGMASIAVIVAAIRSLSPDKTKAEALNEALLECWRERNRLHAEEVVAVREIRDQLLDINIRQQVSTRQ